LPGNSVLIRIGWTTIDRLAACGRQVTAHLQTKFRTSSQRNGNRMTQASGLMKGKPMALLGIADNRSVARIDA